VAYQILVATSTNLLNANGSDIWSSGQIYSDKTIHVEYGGPSLASGQRLWWKVGSLDLYTGLWKWSTNAFFQMGLLDPANDWGAAKWIGQSSSYSPNGVCPMYRKAFFQPTNQIKQATAYISAKGVYELWINGKRIGQNILAPEWTDYRTTIQYQTLDVTTNLVSAGSDGSNHVVGAIAGEGWFSGSSQIGNLAYGNPFPQPLLRIVIVNSDNSVSNVVTDTSWNCFTDGPFARPQSSMGKHTTRPSKLRWSIGQSRRIAEPEHTLPLPSQRRTSQHRRWSRSRTIRSRS